MIKEDPGLIQTEVLLGMQDGAIERSEKRGQDRFVAADAIPTKFMAASGVDTEECLVAMGFELGDPLPSDPLFRFAKLPAGWKKRATSHAMHSAILDERGFERVSIFYKAAFYDRKAHLSLTQRLFVTRDYSKPFDPDSNEIDYIVTAQIASGDPNIRRQLVLKRFSTTYDPDGPDPRYKVSDRVFDEALEWIAENYPDYKSPMAYWDLDFPDGEVIENQ